ncbi:Uncharacterised protein [BD1-7 clade bacterium]|uniref:VanZ-like domain-containing protein n=1 Tax=BD1-7 clade bacterium TaxID=2029982 RepID=A0A5S9MWL0_9GAMM|nr:Uncharacterised protein [BD1-7 clade bacterium]
MIRFTLSHVLLTGYIVLLCWLSLKPPSESSDPLMWDKLAHFIAYDGFATLALIASTSQRRFLEWLITGFALGVMLELLQASTGYRTGSVYDQIANTLGLAAGGGLALLPPIKKFWFIDTNNDTATNPPAQKLP